MKLKFRNIKINKKTKVFSFFVLISAILWFLNALNQEYTTEIKIPVNFVNFPKDKANTSKLPTEFIATVKANGNEIFKYQLKSKFIPFKIDLSFLKYQKLLNKNSNNYYILTRDFMDQIEAQMLGKMHVEMLKPDTVYFHFTPLISKKVPIISKIKIIPRDQFIVKGKIKINPDSITIKGPKTIIDTIKYIQTINKTYNDVYTNIKSKIPLEKINNIRLEPKYVNITAKIEQYTEVSFKVPITPINVPDSINLYLFPNYVTIVCKVGKSNYQNVSASDFEVIVDFNFLMHNIGSKLPTKVIVYPSDIYDFYQTPEFVEYIIDKKNKK